VFAQEALFTRVSQDERYEAKAFIDTFVYRAVDVVGAQVEGLLGRKPTGQAPRVERADRPSE